MICEHELTPGQIIKIDRRFYRFVQMEGPYVRYEQDRSLGYKGPGLREVGLAYLDAVTLLTPLELELL